ncbi:FecR family protein [Parapedobacter koreensis]|uniref:FecR family protein n=1 Tax=Parapedobacter koreensis TaxID=332977 RepID=A0A1H7PJ66_9SPHI|nr:FecR family protein [Parapedobacter koreensis]SEL35325.1 FecR family protein [Parapedobacter koreensis]
MTQEELSRLLERYANGACTEEEEAKLRSWYDTVLQKKKHTLPDSDSRYLKQKVLASVKQRMHEDSRKKASPLLYRARLGRYIVAAASLLVAVVLGYYFLGLQPSVNDQQLATTEIVPGGNRAMLSLADGRKIALRENQAGVIIGDAITYTDGTSVFDEGMDGATIGGVNPLELTTPMGGTYRVTLPDGTNVWLNSASTLRYPSRFVEKERVVEFIGEGYFAVAKDNGRPFKVITAGQEIEVLGTEFNISTYDDEPEIKTTLVEGSVRVAPVRGHRQQVILRPGQQSVVQGESVVVREVDIAPYIAWKSGMFHFKQTPLEEMMRQIERWYDVEVVYKSQVPQEKFGGKMKRNVSLPTVLKLLKASEIGFHIEGKKIIID